MTECVAIYGGSFDPPHLGHTLACAYVLGAHEVDRVLVVPVAAHPFSKRLAPFTDRLRMCELAFADLKRVEISSVEAELPAPSLTLQTIEHFNRELSGATLRLVIGSDLLAQTARWHGFDRIAELAPPIVVARVGYECPEATGPALPDVNSSDLRTRLRAGASTQGLLHPQVAAYARARDLYSASGR